MECARVAREIPEQWPPLPQWLSADESPWGVAVVDCRAYALGMRSVTQDAEVAASFTALRSNPGDHLRGAHPDDGEQVPSTLEWPVPSAPPDGPIFRAGAMEDKWDVTCHAGCLYFTRSWTGNLIYRLQTQFNDGLLSADAVEYDPSQANVELAPAVVDYIVKSHLLGFLCPHPALVPGDDPHPIALASFSLFGRAGWFATHDDTLQFRPD